MRISRALDAEMGGPVAMLIGCLQSTVRVAIALDAGIVGASRVRRGTCVFGYLQALIAAATPLPCLCVGPVTG